MEKENLYIEKDVLGIPASSEEDAKFKAKEQLEFLKKKCIKINEARKTSGYSSYEVDVEYMDPEDYNEICNKVKDTIVVPTKDEEYAKKIVLELLESNEKEDIKILNIIKSTEKESCSVEVEYSELEDVKGLK